MSDGCELGCSDGSELGPLSGREQGPLDGLELGQTDGNSLGVKLGCDNGLELGLVPGWAEEKPDAVRHVTGGGRRVTPAASCVRSKAGPTVSAMARTNASSRVGLTDAGSAEGRWLTTAASWVR